MSTVTAPAVRERTVMTVWPSIGAGPLGRWLGRKFANRWGVRIGGVPLTLGWTLAVLTLPLTAFLYFYKIVPRLPLVVAGWRNDNCRRYRLTTRRMVIDHPFGYGEYASIAHSDWDRVELEVRPGHAWYRAADLVFYAGPTPVLRLAGVPHAEPFRQTCLKTRQAVLAVAG